MITLLQVRTYDYENYLWVQQMPKVSWVLGVQLLRRGNVVCDGHSSARGKRRPHVAIPPSALTQELRAPLFALRAFNVETALIGEHAKGEMLVLMRCQVGSGAAFWALWLLCVPLRMR